ncbi:MULTISPECIES: TetR/AcrR family transcriptional regulator [Streptomyces]|uniref:TetR/AcrR family transcriptional regulator n=1 Tax=Streptomyces TaxID=1883 RepID=UPI0029B253D4|nr:helix-turn-helix domain-containing protein [Streptomyces sp. WI03-4A]MDX2591562.1 helix-turn-helix domain containing protein [Streptomyces sp. WI03-4A]
MRADAARNMTTLLRTGARLLAEDPSTSMAAIALAAGVDRTTIHRRFASREALLQAVFHAKLDASERVLDDARLAEAPVPVALHRYLEGIIPVSREWPVDTRRMMEQDPGARDRRDALSERLLTFLRRAADEGYVRSDVDASWTYATLGRLVDTVAHDFPTLQAPQAADLVADTFLRGLGAR